MKNPPKNLFTTVTVHTTTKTGAKNISIRNTGKHESITNLNCVHKHGNYSELGQMQMA
jgi:hypothetical protein